MMAIRATLPAGVYVFGDPSLLLASDAWERMRENCRPLGDKLDFVFDEIYPAILILADRAKRGPVSYGSDSATLAILPIEIVNTEWLPSYTSLDSKSPDTSAALTLESDEEIVVTLEGNNLSIDLIGLELDYTEP